MYVYIFNRSWIVVVKGLVYADVPDAHTAGPSTQLDWNHMYVFIQH